MALVNKNFYLSQGIDHYMFSWASYFLEIYEIED